MDATHQILRADSGDTPGLADTLLVIHNPTAGVRRLPRLHRAVAAWCAAGLTVEVRATEHAGHAAELARDADPGLRAVVAAGGDGTINEVVHGLMARSDGRPPPLGVLAMGTANVLAHELGLPFRGRPAAAIVVHGRERVIHPGLVGDRPFLMMVGTGFDARVVRRVGGGLKRRLGKGAFYLAAAGEVVAGRAPGLAIRVDGRDTGSAACVIVSRGRYYAGRFLLAPEADLSIPMLNTCLFRVSTRAATVAYLAALATGRLARRPGFALVPGREVAIDGPPGEPVQADGEEIGTLPVTIRLAARPIRVLVP
ncbi:MAG: diacylglycerol kinase family lipid kinase [Azospirillaceae bacterium]